MTTLEYKGYIGSAEVDVEDEIIFGRVLHIRDVVSYHAENASALVAAFREAVDEYLSSCAEANKEPDVPFKGSFNVRVGPERHREAALLARRNGVGLNDLVCEALDLKLRAPATVRHLHRHELVVKTESPLGSFVAGADPVTSWGGLSGRA